MPITSKACARDSEKRLWGAPLSKRAWILEAEQMRALLDSIPMTREVKIPKKRGGGVKIVADVKGMRDRARRLLRM
jgi:hypothetical protein